MFMLLQVRSMTLRRNGVELLSIRKACRSLHELVDDHSILSPNLNLITAEA
jgi:hypothetical protein